MAKCGKCEERRKAIAAMGRSVQQAVMLRIMAAIKAGKTSFSVDDLKEYRKDVESPLP